MSCPRPLLLLFSHLLSIFIFAQSPGDSISEEYTKKVVSFLASDKLKGRVNYSAGLEEAAAFLNNEFASTGLHALNGAKDFYVPFRITTGAVTQTGKLIWNGKPVNDSLFYFFAKSPKKRTKELSDFISIKVDFPFADELLLTNWNSKEDLLFWVNIPPGESFSKALKNIMLPADWPGADILIVSSAEEPTEIKYTGEGINADGLLNPPLNNIIGMIPGKSRGHETIIFSAHYDHVDHDLAGKTGEIFNGANDDASGVAAVLALARYYTMRKDNERTLLFCLFAGEELGLLGSQAFAASTDLGGVKAVINIEMIGRTNVSGKDAFFVTGPERSDLTRIISRNLKGEKTRLIELSLDPALLFMRSDNFSFYEKGIPAHSFMCSDDKEPCYHKPCDDADKLDYDNMIRVIRAIAKGVRTLVSGADTPVLKKQ